MRPPPERLAVQQVVHRLAELLELAPAQRRPLIPRAEVDAVVDVGGHTFVIEWRASGAAASVSMAVEQVRRYADASENGVVPLVAVPFMGPVGRKRCEEAGVAWLDLSGNARILAPGIRVVVEGKPNRFKRPGRPSSPFAPKSSRIARWLLMHPGEPLTQREVARATGMDEGFTSRIVARLEDDELITRAEHGAIRATDPDLLLDAWREDYDFSKHRIFRGHVAARSGDALLRMLAERLDMQAIGYAATGLSAAWLLTRFAGFRLVTIYVVPNDATDLLARLDIREEERGANVWLALPSDEGVLQGAAPREGIRCVHPVQAYLDLLSQPERAKEAADQLRNELLIWSTDG